MSNFTLETPYLIEQATVEFKHEPSTLQTYVAEQLGVNHRSINFTSGSSENGANVFFQSTNFVGYDPVDTFTGLDTVTLTYTNSVDGSTGTLSFDYLVVASDSEATDWSDGGESVLSPYGSSYRPGVNRKTGNILEDSVYYGFDNYLTYEQLLSTFTDTFGEQATVKSILNVYYAPNGDSNSALIDYSDNGEYLTLSAEAVGSSEFNTPGRKTNRAFLVEMVVQDDVLGEFVYTSRINGDPAPEGYVQPEPPVLVEPTPFEGYDPINNWKPQRRLEINPGGPAAESLGDELVINDASGRLFGLNNRASDSTFDELTGVAFVMGAEGAFDDGTIAGKEYIGTLEFDLQEGYRTTANFNNAQLNPILGSVSSDGTLDGALVDTETGEVMALFENVNVI